MMLREIELSVHVEMTGEARLRIAPGVHNEFSAPATYGNVFATRSVTRFAAMSSCGGRMWIVSRLLCVNRRNMNARVRAGRENARVVCVAIHAGIIARERGARHVRRRDDRALNRGTGDQKHWDEQRANSCRGPRNFAPEIALRRRCTGTEHDGVCNESSS